MSSSVPSSPPRAALRSRAIKASRAAFRLAASASASQGTIRATGRPCAVMAKLCPSRTSRSRREKLRLASAAEMDWSMAEKSRQSHYFHQADCAGRPAGADRAA